MNEITLLRESGPEAPPLRPQARSAARAALLAEIEGTPAGRRARRPGRRTTLQIGAGLLAVAAAWTTAVVVAPDGPGTPADGVTLVHFDTPTFPLSLDPVPDGLTPAFDGDGDGSWIAAYDDAAEENGFTVYVGDHAVAPDEGAPGSRSHGASEVSVGDTEAELVRYSRDWCTGDAGVDCGRRSFTRLSWERADDQWVTLLAYGRYRTPERIVAIAESLVDRPQPATLQVGLAPAGWSVQFFTMGRVLTLADDADEQQTVTVHVPLPEDVSPPDQLRGQLMGPVGPLMTVTVQGRPAYLVRIDAGGRDTGWYLQAQFADGTTFVVQAPEAFTQEQVIAFADQVMHNS